MDSLQRTVFELPEDGGRLFLVLRVCGTHRERSRVGSHELIQASGLSGRTIDVVDERHREMEDANEER